MHVYVCAVYSIKRCVRHSRDGIVEAELLRVGKLIVKRGRCVFMPLRIL